MTTSDSLHRREFIKLSVATGLALSVSTRGEAAADRPMAMRRIPATGEEIPVIGLGTSHEFDELPPDGGAQLKAVITTLVEHGGTLIDTAPAYGDSERILGRFYSELGLLETIFVSTKVKETGRERGLASLARSQELLGKRPLDLVMVHGLLDAHTQLQGLRQRKEEGRVRYIGVTTASDRGYEQMESLIEAGGLDFIQVNYSPFETGAAQRIIPAAANRGVAVMINRPFGNGSYFRQVAGRVLPAWTEAFECESWAQFSLKYILGDPRVTCVLAATSNPRHMRDNARAGTGLLPDAATRARMVEHLRTL